MKKKLLLAFSLMGAVMLSHAQTKIGGTAGAANKDAYLQLGDAGANKGLLLSRVALTSTTSFAPLSAHVAGMYVYNTATAGAGDMQVTPGLYYNDGAKWVRVQQNGQMASLLGNGAPGAGGAGAPAAGACTQGAIYTDTLTYLNNDWNAKNPNPTFGQQWTCNGSGWVSYSAPPSTEWYLSGATNDAGNNKTAAIYRDGNVGIGTTAPTDKLHIEGTVNGDVSARIRNRSNGNSAGAVLRLTNDGATAGLQLFLSSSGSNIPAWGGANVGTLNNAAGPLRLNSNTEYGGVYIAANTGNVGIGTSAPTDLLHVEGTVNGTVTARIKNSSNGNGSGTVLRLNNDGATAGLQLFLSSTTNNAPGWGGANVGTIANSAGPLRINSNTTLGGVYIAANTGNVGIGTTSPSYTLHVNGSVAGTSAYNNLSDARYKKDVQPIGEALEKVQQLKGITFNWNQPYAEAHGMNVDSRNHYGFLAQEIEKVLPQIVTTGKDENHTKTVAYSDVVPVLVEAIKEQQAQIEDLKKQVAELKAAK